MNERIRELFVRAGGQFGHYGEPILPDIEVFAELIVEQCVAQCWTVSEMEHKGDVISECSKRMRKHFGVEE